MPSAGGVLVPPEYVGKGMKHTHAKVGGGSMTHEHDDAEPGHSHDGCLPTPKEGKNIVGFILGLEVKAAPDVSSDGTLHLTGYANTWAIDRDDERFARKAFANAIDTYMLNPVVCLEHNRQRPIGYVEDRPILDDTGVKVRIAVPKPPDDTEPWHKKAYHDIKSKILRALSVGGVFFRNGKTIDGMDWYETSVTAVPANQFSIFSVAEGKGLSFKDWAQWDASHGRSTAEASNPKVVVSRAIHTHKNGVRHAHAGGTSAHSHAKIPVKPGYRGVRKADGSIVYTPRGDPSKWGDREPIVVRGGKAQGDASSLIKWFEDGADGQIDWGSPGDWQQCVDVASKHMDADQAKGYCELRHQGATGMSTSEHAHKEKKSDAPKKEGFPAGDFAYIPDAEKPSTWKLRLTSSPGGDPDPGIVGAAAAALSPGGFRGQRVDIPDADREKVVSKVRSAWRKANPDKEDSDMPDGIRDTKTSGDTQGEDPADEAEEIDERGDFGDLLNGLLEALNEVIDRDDLEDQEKVDAINGIMQEFVDEAPDYIDNGTADTGDNTKSARRIVALLGHGFASDDLKEKVLATIQRGTKEITDMGEKEKNDGKSAAEDAGSTPPPPNDATSSTAEISADDVKAMRARLATLEQERHEREMESLASRIADERLAKEAEDRKAAEDRENAEAARVETLVRQAMDKRRDAVNTGTKYTPMQGGASPQPVVGGKSELGGRLHLGMWLKDLRDARRGDFDAFRRVKDGHTKSLGHYGYADEKALNETAAGGGGYLVPPEYWQAGLAEFRLPAAPMQSLVTHMPAMSNQLLIPRATGTAAVAWVAENATKPSTDQTFGQITVNIFALAGISKVSNQLLDDSSPTVDPFVRMDLGRDLALAVDKALLYGDGNGKPTGVYNTSGVATLPIGSAKLWIGLSQAMTTVASSFYGPARHVVLHPRDVAKLREAVDSAGRPIFTPGYTATNTIANPDAFINNPSQTTPVGKVWGMDVYEDANIPSNYGGGTNETFAIVGDLSQGYIFERQGVTMDVSNEAGTAFETNQTWFRGEQRLGATFARQPTAFAIVTGLTPTAG